MQRIIFGTLIILIILLNRISIYSQKDQIKIGVVDVGIIIKELPEAVDADKQINETSKKYQDTLLSMQKELEEKYQSYMKQKAMMPAEQQQKEEETLQALNLNMIKYREEIFGQTGRLMQLREKYLEPIRDKIKKAIENVAKEEKINFVFDISSSVLLYSEEKANITYKVLDKIKRGGTN